MGMSFRSGIWALALLGLAACDDPALMGAAPVVQSPIAQAIMPTHYDAVPDNGLTVPAVPVAEVPPEMLQQQVPYPTDQAVGTIIIDPSTKHLYLITAKNTALRYGIAVGRAGFGWSGEAEIVGRTTWPKWIPPHEMIDRRPELEKFRDVGQPGGLTNPLGARALYLKTNGVDYGYRIHGTPEWESIGHNASSGCIRMINQDVMDLYNRVPDGTHVVVLTEDGQFPSKLTVPPPAPKARKPKPVVAPVTAPLVPVASGAGRV
jgi:lipoprotein-anchoring transpeptidase ErfK/SrfK